jgi:hypothetical protein
MSSVDPSRPPPPPVGKDSPPPPAAPVTLDYRPVRPPAAERSPYVKARPGDRLNTWSRDCVMAARLAWALGGVLLFVAAAWVVELLATDSYFNAGPMTSAKLIVTAGIVLLVYGGPGVTLVWCGRAIRRGHASGALAAQVVSILLLVMLGLTTVVVLAATDPARAGLTGWAWSFAAVEAGLTASLCVMLIWRCGRLLRSGGTGAISKAHDAAEPVARRRRRGRSVRGASRRSRPARARDG